MATVNQIISLPKVHNYTTHNEKFKTVVLQIAAYEAKRNHGTLARELKKLAEKTGSVRATIFQFNQIHTNSMVTMSVPAKRVN
ncbi:MAG: hypothetical protein JEY71_04300 [Sphaerochaeta sp.]|nr:hypothetical protein [Sphaerochaeta sp.]